MSNDGAALGSRKLKMTRRPSENAEQRFAKATEARRGGRFEEAEVLYRRVVVLAPDNADAHHDLGRTLVALGRGEAALESYRNAVAVNPGYAGSRRNMGILLEDLGRDAEAEAAYRGAVAARPNFIRAYRSLASFLRRRERFDEANAVYRDGIAALLKEQGGLTRKDLRAIPTIPGFSRRRAAAALFDIQTILDGLGIAFFLVFGTALGCIREGGLMSHDQDIDLGVWHGADMHRIAEALLAAGYSLTPGLMTDSLLDDGVMRLPIRHANGIYIDLYPHMRAADGRCWSCIDEGRSRVAWWNSTFELRETAMLGGRFNVPDDTTIYLEENFGAAWTAPDPFFEGTVNAANIEGGYPPISRCYAHYFVLKRLMREQWAAAHYMFAFMRTRDPGDPGLRVLAPYFDL